MKKFSLILTVFLLGVMLVSCGTTLKKTSDKSGANSVNPVLTMEKTAKPEKFLIEVKREGTYLYTGSVFEIIAQKGTVEANAKVKMVIDFQRKENYNPYSDHHSDIWESVKSPFREVKEVQAKADGSFGLISEITFYYWDSDKYEYIKISLTAQAEGKEESEPIEFNGLEYF